MSSPCNFLSKSILKCHPVKYNDLLSSSTEKAMCSFDVLLGKKMIAGMEDNLGFIFN